MAERRRAKKGRRPGKAPDPNQPPRPEGRPEPAPSLQAPETDPDDIIALVWRIANRATSGAGPCAMTCLILALVGTIALLILSSARGEVIRIGSASIPVGGLLLVVLLGGTAFRVSYRSRVRRQSGPPSAARNDDQESIVGGRSSD